MALTGFLAVYKLIIRSFYNYFQVRTPPGNAEFLMRGNREITALVLGVTSGVMLMGLVVSIVATVKMEANYKVSSIQHSTESCK